MVNNQRVFPRIKFKITARFDFVDMDEKDMECAKDVFGGQIVDISVEAIKLHLTQNISEVVVEQVLRREKKVRLNFQFNADEKAVNTFATLIRYDSVEKNFVLEYLDIPVNSLI